MSFPLAPSSNAISAPRGKAKGGIVARYATIVTTATFLVTAVTGVLMFYHLDGRYLRTAHDWIGMAFVIAAVFHVVRNWRAFVKLMKKPRTQVVVLLVALVTAGCIWADSVSPKTRGHRYGEAAPIPTESSIDGIG
jgi:hypothetical protein